MKKVVNWGFVSASEVEELITLGRPCMGWPSLRKNAVLTMLSVLIDGSTSSNDCCTRKGMSVSGPLLADQLACSSIETLPIRPATIDCLVFSFKQMMDSSWKRQQSPSSTSSSSSSPTFISKLSKLLHHNGICFAIVPGRITLDMLLYLQEELLAFDWIISTVRQITPQNQNQCGPRVLEVGQQVLGLGSSSSKHQSEDPSSPQWERERWFGVIQIQQQQQQQQQQHKCFSGNSGERLLKQQQKPDLAIHLIRLIETSLYLDRPPLPIEELSLEDIEYLHPPPPSACSLHLGNYYKWREVYPELQLLLDNFNAIRKEAEAVAKWTPWPEYHFRDGGESDWRVVPFLHTFPASDHSKSCWIQGTSSRCPETTKLLRQLPRCRTALFSRLGPGTKLSAHTGWEDLANFVLRVHLTLWTPPGVCGTWVEGEVRLHEEKDFIVFDDSKVHKAFNLHPTESRVVLILDMARPDWLAKGVAVGGHTEELDTFISAFQ